MTRKISMSNAINEAMQLAMRQDEHVILLGEDVAGGAEVDHLQDDEAWGGVFGVTKGLVQEFGRDRVLDTPISEAGYVGAAMAAAATGLRPIAELMFNDFIGSCLDQVLNQGAKLRYMFGGKAQVPVTIRTMHGAGFRAAAQHSQSLYAMFTAMPGIKVVVPSTPYDAKGLLLSAIEDNDPVIFFEDKTLYNTMGEVPEGHYTIPLGKADIKRRGDDLSVVAIGKQVHTALTAADLLAKKGIEVEVIDPRSLSPLDSETILTSVEKTNRLIVIDEANPRCSMATDIAALVADEGFDFLDAPIKRITAPHTPVPFSPPLEDLYLPTPENVIQAVSELLGNSSLQSV
ncbi:alpha-ketoacid dehydrogenase subunit beta [Halalkalibacterium halodurans]|uniref:Acetoin dehydrogenase E1 component (TPP-dependent beta subunit) n=1 Tax=Halalkalibacterium halodurans (strain ATCC BAA-125 / DSM 18197 / FERM 7344 / JCM 9153 / C-125) TaxID=272558 RepID=Q9KBV1_HALH5|nr:alpha-ketoacid dehydrogenase subunit beta [Halalkalibacterium halodurans]MDY7222383.1 alpha-ketoacid dehydrogenase subunit beta [Halalkalibacterium halodurans]MDY7241604.1 alpha-ketoacid dehydrogenase subunit beta [Halalkalibacterium halodurans]MED4124985.1 alpha-ketoacid dehydrogenase subunit beta [Halalkalibacterium halodurans]MED4171824.1 alpha-ketoacid dehydrogenase subunit beta [Halalkalibacterium halodurans]BAB05542.1 acetoin dehydrogenase E1 component (TPP-dependent beta subunit) [Ha